MNIKEKLRYLSTFKGATYDIPLLKDTKEFFVLENKEYYHSNRGYFVKNIYDPYCSKITSMDYSIAKSRYKNSLKLQFAKKVQKLINFD